MALAMDQDDEPRTLPLGGTILLLALATLLLAFRLGGVPLLGPDEPRYARVAVEMSRSGDLVTPTLQGQPWLEKPILYYWLAAGAMKMLGETETAARLPAVAAALLLILTTALLGARLYGRAAGLHAGFIVATALLTFATGRAASMDMLLAGTVGAGLALLGVYQLGIGGPMVAMAGGAFLGLAVLAKGPIGLLLPILVLGTHFLIMRRHEAVRPAVTPAAILAFLAVAMPWYLLVWRAQGRAFVETFFVQHNVERFTSTVHHHPGSIFYYVPVLLVGLFPWSGLVLPAVGMVDRRQSSDVWLLSWVLVPLAFFSLAGSKLPGYILPVVLPLAILMGRAAAALVRGERPRDGLGPTAVGALTLPLGFLLLGAAAWLVWRREPGATLLLPVGVWAAVIAWLAARVIRRSTAEALRSLRVGAAGFLLLLTVSAPALLARRESGRDLFVGIGGREVLVWRAWRTAWMAGYFYNDAHVREVMAPVDIITAARQAPTLALTAPDERLMLEATPDVEVHTLRRGPRNMQLLELRRR
jgi:4-amino-4-deoxy-L-arabinose transferase-like glycosyltransferase